MNRYLLDVNTLLALLDPRHVFHEAAHHWAERAPDVRWLTCPLVQNGVMRVAGQSTSALSAPYGRSCRLFARTRATSSAPTTFLCSMPPISLARTFSPPPESPIYLLALAHHHQAFLATFDRRIPAEAVRDGPAAIALIDA